MVSGLTPDSALRDHFWWDSGNHMECLGLNLGQLLLQPLFMIYTSLYTDHGDGPALTDWVTAPSGSCNQHVEERFPFSIRRPLILPDCGIPPAVLLTLH